jgi:hydrogenase nickel incorporation protein HypB
MSAERVSVREKVLSANDRLAADVRERLETEQIFAVNLISSPGSGKTTLLERTIDLLKPKLRVAIVAGDVQTRNDAERLIRHDVPVEAIETGGGCHLDARQVAKALASLDLAEMDLLFIENVGNLVCPSSFDLGESLKVVLLSVTEGEDKPLKYPAAFRRAMALVVTKTDLVPHLEFSEETAIENARSISPDLEIWTDWLCNKVAERKRSRGGAGT